MDVASATKASVPLFPLNHVLFTDGLLRLRIFEPRYVDMVGRCMREGTGFGVVLIRDGHEARTGPDDEMPKVFDLGTYAEITDFDRQPDGLLGIVGTGRRKFRILNTSMQRDGLMLGEVQYLPDEPGFAVSDEFRPLADLLEQLLSHPSLQWMKVGVDLRDGRAVSWRLAELLPVQPEIKQSLLKMAHPRERLTELKRLVERLQ